MTDHQLHRRRLGVFTIAVIVCLFAGTAFWRRSPVDENLTAVVQRGSLTALLTTTGTLRPAQAITYRSPLGGREAEIVELAPEGVLVNEGDLLVRLETTELQRELERARQELRQAQLDVQVADIERREAEAAATAVSQGEGALTVEEIRTRLQLAEKRVERLRREYDQMKPLLDKGFVTRDELHKIGDELEQSEQEAALMRKRADIVITLSHPRDSQRASLQVAQKLSALENARAKARDAAVRLRQLGEQLESARMYARRAGLVVYEEFLSASPRRKVRVGDRVTGSQGIVTIPEVSRMLLESSVGEAEVHRVHPGQPAVVRVEAFPDLRLTGRVNRVGSLARASADRPFEDKRFDLVVGLDATPAELRPEMSARADIVVGTRSDVLLLPITAVFEQRGQMVAHVMQRFGIETRALAIGESNDVQVEIVNGVREGDQVLLTEPGRTPGALAPPGPSPGIDRARQRTTKDTKDTKAP